MPHPAVETLTRADLATLQERRWREQWAHVLRDGYPGIASVDLNLRLGLFGGEGGFDNLEGIRSKRPRAITVPPLCSRR